MTTNPLDPFPSRSPYLLRKWDEALNQGRELIDLFVLRDPKVTCPGCNRRYVFHHMFRCRECGVYYCGSCSLDHFGLTSDDHGRVTRNLRMPFAGV